ncbi:MAG: hypothetical protein AAF366_17120 [Pseudomonadota bacterium]
MTIIHLHSAPSPRRTLIEAAIAAHGPLPVLRAALAALLRRKPKGRHVMASAHLRRDIGLPPLPDRPYGPFG